LTDDVRQNGRHPDHTGRFVALVDASRNPGRLKSICQAMAAGPLVSAMVLHKAADANEVSAILAQTGAAFEAVPEQAARSVITRARLKECPGTAVAYISCEIEPEASQLRGIDPSLVRPLLPALRIKPQEHATIPIGDMGWIAPAEVALDLLAAQPEVSEWGFRQLIAVLERSGRRVRWGSTRMTAAPPDALCGDQDPAITTRSQVLAFVPHYRCEQWLAQCLHSLTSQTRPPDNIVVVDDNSPEPPREIVQRFPEVTLLATRVNIGPENILHDVIRTTDYDAYMIQDADDWCAVDRLEHSLLEAERTGAEVVGGQEISIIIERPEILLKTHPLDVNRSLAENIAHSVCHGASLIARSLALRAGGFDHTLRVAADTDFTLRAAHLGRIVNLPRFYYYRRMRPNSRISAQNTGHGSAIRIKEKDFIYRRAQRNAEFDGPGIAPEVVVPEGPSPAEFRHILGPKLRNILERR